MVSTGTPAANEQSKQIRDRPLMTGAFAGEQAFDLDQRERCSILVPYMELRRADHALALVERGLSGILSVEGPSNPDVHNGQVMTGMEH